MNNGIKITKEQSEKFYESLTDQERKVLDKATKLAMKPYFEGQAEMQKTLKTQMNKFIQNKRI